MSDVDALLERAIECTKSGALEDAGRHLQALLAIQPESELGTGMLAALCAEQGQLEEAAQLFERTLQINPNNALARLQLGFMQLRLEQSEAALQTFDTALEQKEVGPNACFIHYYRALALMQLDQRDAARAALKRAQEFMPTNHALYGSMVDLMVKLDRPG